MSVPGVKELVGNFFQNLKTGYIESRREKEDFTSDLGQLAKSLEGAYSVNDAVFSLNERLQHARAEGGYNIYPAKSTVVNGDLGDARIYLENLKYDPDHARSMVEAYHKEHAWNPTSSRIGLAKIDNDLLINPREKKLGVDNYSHAVVQLAHGMAKLKLLVENGERGIPEAYPAARDVVASELAIVEKAASIIAEWDSSWGTPSVDRAISLASKKLSLDSVLWRKKVEATGLIAGALALAACSAAMPTESKPNFDPATVATPIESGRTELETPAPGMSEFESSVPATMEAMSIQRLNELREKFLKGQVVGYQEQINPSSGALELGTITLSEEYKAQMHLRDGMVLSEPGGGQWECLFYEIVYGDVSEAVMACNVEGGGMFIPYRQTDSNRGLMQWNFFVDSSGNYPVSSVEAAIVRPVMLLEMASGVDISRGWMWSPKDGKLHEIKDAAVNFKNAAAFPITNRYAAEETLEDEYGNAAYTWPVDGKPTLTFDNGMVFEWDGTQYVQVENDTAVESAPMSELDQQIFDSAPEIEGVEKVMHNLWGVVGVDENGEITKYWDYYEYNYDRGDWREVVREENGHLVILNAKGEEQIVYPERITLNVNGKEITYNTTARGYKENVTPQTPEEYKAVIEALAQAITEGKVLRPFGDNPVSLSSFNVLRGFNGNSEARVVLDISSGEWVKRSNDELPYSPVIFPLQFNGKLVDGVVIAPTMIHQGDNDVSGWWSLNIVKAYWTKHPINSEIQRLMDNDVLENGGKAAMTPFNYRSLAACTRSLDNPDLAVICEKILAESSKMIGEFERSIALNDITEELVSGKYIPIGVMQRVSE